MKRKREGMEKFSEIKSAIQLLSPERTEGQVSTTLFLNVCSLLLQVLDKIGPTLAVLRQDIHQNVRKVEKLYETDRTAYSNLIEIVKKEVGEGIAKNTQSCTRAILWLTRSLEFTISLLEKVTEDPDRNLQEVVEESYGTTLKLWHGWISYAAYKVALKLIPNNKTFISLLVADGEDYKMLKEDVKSFVTLLLPILTDIHAILTTYGVHKLKSP
ncbi:glycolipid transfer protein 3-like [Aristolochia californica]|uniref:glycolipid transfer protein 3-like n=1 Tax=Aristolochia californica TaxID=171875 RepID=UPI0035DD7C65